MIFGDLEVQANLGLHMASPCVIPFFAGCANFYVLRVGKVGELIVPILLVSYYSAATFYQLSG